nr:HAD family phosphatase [Faecalicatena contorta]
MLQNGMLNNIDGIIFDMDGTLIDSMWIWPAVDIEFFKKYNLEPPEDFHVEMEGMSYAETAQYFLDTFPTLSLTLQEVMDEWTEMAMEKYLTQVPLKEGAKDFLDEMKKRGIKLGIATSNGRELVDETLKVLEIAEIFDSVVTAGEVGVGKPAPDVYLKVASEIGIDPTRCLVFEDVPMGILAGKNAGMKVCAVEDDFSREQRSRKKELADYYICDYYEIKSESYEVL